MSDPNDPSSFNFTFSSTMDASGTDRDLFIYMNVLRIDGHTRRAVMLENRPGGDVPDRAVGLFATTLSQDQVGALQATVEGIKWNELPETKGADISAATLSLDYSRGQRMIQRSFNARNSAFLAAINPLMSQVTDLMRLVAKHPARAVHVAATRTASGLRLVLRNVGTGAVVVADPRNPNGPKGATCGWVGAAFDRPSPPRTFSPPIPLEPVALGPLGNAPPFVTLEAGKTLEVDTIPWTPAKPGKYFARANWRDYSGPEGDPQKVLPLVPDPDQLATDQRPYRIRGAAFSGILWIDAEKR